jgi:SMODS and SLOG-associating 2TM effector domain 3/SMODS and SLOG-associating 2TM effector domain 1
VPTTQAIRDPEDLPALYGSANQQSLDAQSFFLTWLKVRLCGLVIAAIGGAIGWTLGHFQVGGVIAFLAFAVALVAELVLAIQRPDRVWYEARAAAESAKTLSWRYMMRGASFDANVPNVDVRFLEEIANVLHDLDVVPTASARDLQISKRMRQVRALPFEQRREVYLTQRIQDQQAWYGKKAASNETRARHWVVISIVLEFLGLIGGALKAAGWVDVDLLGIFAAAAATATAWLQAKQHQNVATAYGVTSHELAAVASELEALADESLWAQFVAEAEEAISREHTLWRASRGLRVRLRS